MMGCTLKKDDLFSAYYSREKVTLESIYDMEKYNIKIYSFCTDKLVFIKEEE